MPHPFAPLPDDTDAAGQPRRTGVEVEFAGLSERRAAAIICDSLGGEPRQTGGHEWRVEASRIGDIQVYVDSALRHSRIPLLREAGLALGRDVIPVELVSEPLDRPGLALLDEALAGLRAAGAMGSGAGVLYGFGVHLNVGIASADSRGITRPLLAYALIEDWLRWAEPIDEARRALPFTAPYPTRTTRALAQAGPDATPDEIMHCYLSETQDRNHGLDMLPLFAWLDHDAVARVARKEKALNARPTFHFRLPDSRIDEADWSLDVPWSTWRGVERVAALPGLVERLAEEWLRDHGAITLARGHWAGRTAEILTDAGAIGSGAAA